MRKIKIKIYPDELILLCGHIQYVQSVLCDHILDDPKEITIYRLSNAMRLQKRLTFMSLRTTAGKFSTLSFDDVEILTIRYVLLCVNRGMQMQELFMKIDSFVNPQMFERS